MTRRWLPAVALASSFLLLAVSVGAQARPDSARRPAIASVDFEGGAMVKSDVDYAPLNRQIPQIILDRLKDNPGVRVVEREEIDRVLKEQDLGTAGRLDPETAARVGKVIGVRYWIRGRYVIDPTGRVMFTAQAFDAETSVWQYSTSLSGKADKLVDLVMQLADTLNQKMRLPSLPPVAAPSRSGASTDVTTSAPPKDRRDQLRAAVLFGRGLEEKAKGNMQLAIKNYEEGLSILPDYEPARRALASLKSGG